jgi:hypothetical protein
MSLVPLPRSSEFCISYLDVKVSFLRRTGEEKERLLFWRTWGKKEKKLSSGGQGERQEITET